MVLNQEYIRHWLNNNQYLSTIWDTLNENWQHFWNSQLIKELTKPEILKYFALSAFLGIIVPPLIMIGWRMFNRRKSIKNNYTQIDNDAVGSFNAKVIESIKEGKEKQKEKLKDNKDEFDSISPKIDHKKNKKSKKHTKTTESKESESSSLLNEPNKSEKKESKKKSKNSMSMDSTRISNSFSPDDFKLDEHDIEELSHLELHGKLKSATLRSQANKLEEKMSAEERAKEQQLKMEQLEKIFALMQNEGGSKFGINNKEELMDQFKIYSS